MTPYMATWHHLGAWKYLAVALLAVGFLSVGAQMTTQALFTETESLGSNTFSTGTLDIASSPSETVVSFSAMAPGDSIVAPLTVTNGGDMELRYAVTSTTDEDTLAGLLSMTIKENVSSCDASGFSTDGSVVYGPGDLGSQATMSVLGDPAQGEQAGDRVLGASVGETLCVKVELPSGAGNSAQGLNTTATFALSAEQTANNA